MYSICGVCISRQRCDTVALLLDTRAPHTVLSIISNCRAESTGQHTHQPALYSKYTISVYNMLVSALFLVIFFLNYGVISVKVTAPTGFTRLFAGANSAIPHIWR